MGNPNWSCNVVAGVTCVCVFFFSKKNVYEKPENWSCNVVAGVMCVCVCVFFKKKNVYAKPKLELQCGCWRNIYIRMWVFFFHFFCRLETQSWVTTMWWLALYIYTYVCVFFILFFYMRISNWTGNVVAGVIYICIPVCFSIFFQKPIAATQSRFPTCHERFSINVFFQFFFEILFSCSDADRIFDMVAGLHTSRKLFYIYCFLKKNWIFFIAATQIGFSTWWLAYTSRTLFFSRISLPRDSCAPGSVPLCGDVTILLRKVCMCRPIHTVYV
jgi:hypothetical protein